MLTNVTDVKELITRHGYRISKMLGQNFLCDEHALEKIIESSEPANEDVLEIGPGLGVLTERLAQTARSVTAIEVARRLEPILKETVGALPNVKIIYSDFLALDPSAVPGNYVIASNLPYAISTPAIFRFLDGEIRWKRMTITVQAEVAERLASKSGSKTYGALSVAAQASAEVEIVHHLSSSSFWPRPKVASAIVTMTPRPGSRPPQLRNVLRAAFSARRKTLKNALANFPEASEIIKECGLDLSQRPETVPVEKWLDLARRFS